MPATNTTIAAGERAAHAITLTASTVDTVTFTDDVDVVEVISDGVADLYVRVDGTAPTVGGAFSYRLPAGAISSRQISIAGGDPGTIIVKLISSGATKYSVTKVR